MVGHVFMLTRFGAIVRHNGLEANVNAKEPDREYKII